ncbi:hypothetical protein B1L02_19115 [Pseudoalteromonas piscicida]|uniref:Uncharacterized protein n=1 Tax=Pseudoalteromonas piscicida TaxID=43662 RepID=A0AAD0W6H0_PSEO7|nr:hypothetical protein B1L02_19115 [Pseudoalteromonas piscicida]AXR04596.1 hypothetical protein D0511_22210 [Pseudoalteromonas piscicida]
MVRASLTRDVLIGLRGFLYLKFLYPKQKTRRIAATGFGIHGFLRELNCKPSTDKPPPTMLRCADTVVGASLPRDVLIGLRGFFNRT